MTKKRRRKVPREMHLFESDGVEDNPRCLKCGKVKYDVETGFTHDFWTELAHDMRPALEKLFEEHFAEKGWRPPEKKETAAPPNRKPRLAKPKRRPRAARKQRPAG